MKKMVLLASTAIVAASMVGAASSAFAQAAVTQMSCFFKPDDYTPEIPNPKNPFTNITNKSHCNNWCIQMAVQYKISGSCRADTRCVYDAGASLETDQDTLISTFIQNLFIADANAQTACTSGTSTWRVNYSSSGSYR